jgi:hypothetical protein
VPLRARAWAALPQLARDQRAKFQHPAPHRFIGDVKPTLGQQFLDVSVAQGEAEIQPDRVLDDLGREAMTAVGERSHLDILSGTPLSRLRFRDNANAWCPLICCQSFGLIEEATAAAAASSRRISDF